MPPSFLSVRGLVKRYEMQRSMTERLLGRPRRHVHAVNRVSFEIRRGETLGLIGESGCGKSTLGRTVLRLHEPTAGTVEFDGIDVTTLAPAALTRLRARMQIVFQDPYASLNPRKSVREIVGLPLAIQGLAGAAQRNERVGAMLRRVGLHDDQFERYPHQFSGGQRQRIGIARALVTHPELVVCDEPVSALDVSIKAQILELLAELKRDLGLTYLFISHDIATLGYLADRIAVMYLGEIVETGPARDVMRTPRHPYTQALMSAVPQVHAAARRQRIILLGEPPSAIAPPAGCKFHTRCPSAMPRCATHAPAAFAMNADGSHQASCFLYGDVEASAPSGEGECRH
ncbi:MAG: ATP-binding cassette domain-containing protein [Pseudomonadota bacterium]|nr:ATP-binding cassette domain-containing protein [Pseudomonadota bacterium]